MPIPIHTSTSNTHINSTGEGMGEAYLGHSLDRDNYLWAQSQSQSLSHSQYSQHGQSQGHPQTQTQGLGQGLGQSRLTSLSPSSIQHSLPIIPPIGGQLGVQGGTLSAYISPLHTSRTGVSPPTPAQLMMSTYMATSNNNTNNKDSNMNDNTRSFEERFPF